MQTRYDPNSYPLSSFDDDLCLRPPLLIWVVVLYLARAILMPVAMCIGHYAGVNQEAIRLLRGFWRVDTLLPSLLVLPVLYALCRRSPAASDTVRSIWGNGRALLGASLAVDIALNARELIPFDEIDDQTLLPIISAVADAYFLIYVLAARRVRDTFSDFPPPLETAIPNKRLRES
jgi:Protein of unknown function (DUF2919)